ncbi:SDR family oxidoreductase [Rhizobium sp. TRM95796]|uniref:SDR family oxidoreductase n=1 Tax=Rhizobium sp. TRM95796 TaxID=2979862 RepID=UPI0021E7CC56|nr:SDR family oxidoreductase [Rhizobium sp. TRM95796]MCV3764527.1 SDR family oxidoreductase [Rhizobium sp. TRM95796]
MNILVLGATGFIGSAVANRLLADGHSVTGLGRDLSRARRLNQNINWLKVDLSRMTQASDWTAILADVDMVVNCAGALQDGLRDDLAAVQTAAMIALYAAAEPAHIRRIVQISAETGGGAADTAFLSTKRQADDALKASPLDWVILRPSLVVGRNAYGGTALLRGLAALPFILPLVHADRCMATVALDDVAEAISRAVAGKIAAGSDFALTGPERMRLADLVATHRRWLGLGDAPVIALPDSVARPISAIADLAGWLGWRSPLRSTAMRVMVDGVHVSSELAPMPFQSLNSILGRHSSGVQDLWFARMYLLKPVVILVLSLFWLVSGLIPFFALEQAAGHFLPFLSPGLSTLAVVVTSLADIALGLMLLYRPTARLALLGQMGLASAYLLGGSLLEPALWLDPIGPYVKVLPAILLSLVTLAILEER